MRVAYLILTCEKYKDTRRVWQRNTWLRQVNPNDYFFLTANKNPDDINTSGWGAPDDYASAPLKYYHFLKHMPLDEYDWIVFCDDDTFIFPKRLESYLAIKHPYELLYIGRCIDFVPIELNAGNRVNRPMKYMSGGAGFIVSQALYTLIHNHVKQNTPLSMDGETLVEHTEGFPVYGDVYIGAIIEQIKQQVKHIELPYLNYSSTTDMYPIEDAISFHYATEEIFKLYGSFLDSADNYPIKNDATT
jgi:hypothetical protein